MDGNWAQPATSHKAHAPPGNEWEGQASPFVHYRRIHSYSEPGKARTVGCSWVADLRSLRKEEVFLLVSCRLKKSWILINLFFNSIFPDFKMNALQI